MDSNNSHLNHYFNQARKQAPIVSREEISLLVKHQTKQKDTLVPSGKTHQFNHFYHLSWLSAAAAIVLLVITQSPFRNGQITQLPEGLEVASNTGEQVDKSELVINARARKSALRSTLNAALISSENTPVQYLNANNLIDDSEENWLTPILKLDRATLQKIGVTFEAGMTYFETNVKGMGYIMFGMQEELDRRSLTVNDAQKRNVTTRDYYPLFLTKMDGSQSVKFRFDKEPAEKMTQEYFNGVMNDLIPIAIPSQLEDRKHIGVLWFNATDRLYDLLNEANTPIMESPTAERDSPFKEPLLKESRVYPNPAQNDLQLSFLLTEPSLVEIRMVDIQGNILRELMPKSSLEPGTHRKEFNVSDLQKGMYIIQILTNDNGTNHRLSHRFIKN